MNESERKKLPHISDAASARESKGSVAARYFEGGAAAEKQQQLHIALAFSEEWKTKAQHRLRRTCTLNALEVDATGHKFRTKSDLCTLSHTRELNFQRKFKIIRMKQLLWNNKKEIINFALESNFL